jgi:hypothetical protein
MTADAARWAEATDLPALGELVIAWLNGTVNETPLHEGPPCEDKMSLAPVLTLVNRVGFITDNAERGGHGYGGSWAGWIEGIASEGTVTRLREAVAGTPLVMTDVAWADLLPKGVSETWGAWADFCPGAADEIRAARYVTIDDPRPGRDSVLWAALEAFAVMKGYVA